MFEKSDQAFKWRFDEEINNYQNKINLRETLGKSSSDADNGHKKEVEKRAQKTRLGNHGIDMGRLINAVSQERNNRDKEQKNNLA